MASANADETACVPIPVLGDPIRFVVGTTALHYQVPESWKDRWIRIQPTGPYQLYFYCSSDEGARTLVVDQLSGIAGGGTEADPHVLTQHADTGGRYGVGGAETHMFVYSGRDRFVIVAEAADTALQVNAAGE